MNVSNGQFPPLVCAPALPPSKLMWGLAVPWLLPVERHSHDTRIVERGNNSDPEEIILRVVSEAEEVA